MPYLASAWALMREAMGHLVVPACSMEIDGLQPKRERRLQVQINGQHTCGSDGC